MKSVPILFVLVIVTTSFCGLSSSPYYESTFFHPPEVVPRQSQISSMNPAGLSQLGNMIAWRRYQFEQMYSATSALQTQVNDISQKTSDATNFLTNQLNINVKKLTDAVNSLTTQLNAVNGRLTTDEGRLTNLETLINARTSAITELNHMPVSCDEVRQTGNIMSGIYMIKPNPGQYYQAVYCKLSVTSPTTAVSQTNVVNVDVKTQSVYFYVQRNAGPFSTAGTNLPYDISIINVGNAMTLASGLFVAPVKGTYFFAFSGLVKLTGAGQFWISLFKNEAVEVGRTATIQLAAAAGDSYQTIALQSTLALNVGDKISMRLSPGVTIVTAVLHDAVGGSQYTHFTGSLIEQDFTP